MVFCFYAVIQLCGKTEDTFFVTCPCLYSARIVCTQVNFLPVEISIQGKHIHQCLQLAKTVLTLTGSLACKTQKTFGLERVTL